MTARAVRSGKVMPAGVVSVLSACTLYANGVGGAGRPLM